MIKNKNANIKKNLKFKILIVFIFFLLNISILKLYPILKNNIIKNNNKGRIFLCTLYNNEVEMAYIHIWRLYKYVDKFIFIISNSTYSGLSKRFTFKPFESSIKPYMDKIDIVTFNNICNRKAYPNSSPIWCFEYS